MEYPAYDLTFRKLQDEQRPWIAHNFPDRLPFFPLLGVMEELGELAHAHLKGLQNIRHTPEQIYEMKKDSVGDIVVFLADYCSANSIDFQEVMEKTWEKVRRRDWRANPTGAAEGELK